MFTTEDAPLDGRYPEAAGALAEMPLELLETRITELAAHLHAATCRWLLLVGELDRREGWAQWGCRSCAHWLSWRCGVGLKAAREQVRVARSLLELPGIAACFGRGQLSYSQVRALTRIATPELEHELLELARHATAAQLERVVRGYRGVLAVELGDRDPKFESRYVSCRHDEHGSLLIEARLPAEEGELVLNALEAARDHLREQAREGSGEPAPGGAAGEQSSAEAPAADLSAEAPGLDAAEASAEAREAPARVSNADALVLMAETLLGSGADALSGGERHQLVVHVDAATLASDEHDARSGVCELEHGGALHPETARRLACDASVVRIVEADGRPLSIGRKTRSIPVALGRALASRDRGCRFPGCTQRRFVDAHHIEHWARGGRTELGNLVQLCRHHHRLLHEGGYRVERTARNGLLFRRPDGRPIPVRPAARRGDPAEPARANARSGLAITPETCVPNWWGDPLRLPWVVDGLVSADPRLAADP